ncbi:MAG: redox-sensing transcriptional repressor Rex [Bacillota bacterium]
MKSQRISEAVIRRLPRYYRHLMLLDEQGIERISSSELSERMSLNASQIRQDFNCFGGFGQQGYGYHVKSLLGEITNILTLNTTHSMVVAGAGNIGQALSNFDGFVQSGFLIKALFDVKPERIGTSINGKPVLNLDTMESFIMENNIEIGIIAARKSVAQGLVDRMLSAGVKAIWNFAPVDVKADVPIENVHLTDSLAVLAFKLNNWE